jgi:hypothetical protein
MRLEDNTRHSTDRQKVIGVQEEPLSYGDLAAAAVR